MLEMPVADALSRYLSLSTQQMQLTAGNMANQNTPGYVRRDVNWTEGDVVTLGTASSPGVRSSISAQRDSVLQKTVQQATEASSASSTRSTALNALQSLFKIGPSGEDTSGIGAAISDFFNAANSLAASPTGSTAQQSLYTAAQSLATALNRTAAQIGQQTVSLNAQVIDSAGQVNGLTSQIAALNRKISSTGPSDSRDTLIDQRDSLVTNLSKLVQVNTISDKDGSIDLALSNGSPLVTSSVALPLSTVTVSGTVHIYTAASAGGGDVTNVIHGGSIGGAVQARDGDLPAVSSQLDALASAIATSVNTQNAAGTTPSGTAGGPIFSGTTAATLTVIVPDGSAFASTGPTGTAGGNALALGQVQSAAIIGGSTPSQAFAALLSGLGTTASEATTQSSADGAVLAQTSSQLDAVSGVSLDQEAANLTQYQRSYEASAKVLTIVDTLLAQAINLGTPTTVS